MPVNERVFSAKSQDYLTSLEAKLASLQPDQIASRVSTLVREHDLWRRRKCLNMTAAENLISDSALTLLASHLATRCAEGPPGDREFPPEKQNLYVDEIEATVILLAKRLFSARYVEWRAISNTMANAIVLFALTEPGDLIMVQSLRAGANWSYHANAIPRLRGLRLEEIAPNDEYGVDLDSLRRAVRGKRPKFFVIGGSMFLFPFPLEELRRIADECGARILYDAAHVGPLIASGCFQQPLQEGAHVMTMGTHKMTGGPVGGLVFCDDLQIAKPMLDLTFPAFLQTRDQNKFAAAAWSLAEMVQFAGTYARQIVANAKALAIALERLGCSVLFRERGFTQTHQVVLDARDVGAELFENRCQACNILIHKARLPGQSREEPRGGVRIGVQELTRQGMKEPAMAEVASFMFRAAVRNDSPTKLAEEIERFLAGFQRINYSFDPS